MSDPSPSPGGVGAVRRRSGVDAPGILGNRRKYSTLSTPSVTRRRIGVPTPPPPLFREGREGESSPLDPLILPVSPYEGGGHLLKPPMNTGIHTPSSASGPRDVLHWSIVWMVGRTRNVGPKEKQMPRYNFHEALSEAEDFLSLARQHEADGEAEEAEVNVAAAVSALEQLLRPVEPEAV